MARHILQGQVPVFFYGQAYMGSLDALLVAGAFRLLGEQVWVIRLVQSLLYLGVLATTARLGKVAFGSQWVGALAALLLAIPTVNVTLYTTVSLGGYGEALLLGNLILLLGIRLREKLVETQPGRMWGLGVGLGFLMGLGVWAFGLTLVYSLPVLFSLAWAAWRGLRSRLLPLGFTVLAGGLLGSAPWGWFAIQNGLGKLLWELSGGAIAGVEGLPWIFQVGQHLGSLLLLGISVIFGLRPPWDVTWLGLPLLPFALLFWCLVVIFMLRSLRQSGRQQRTPPDDARRPRRVLLAGACGVTLAAFVFTPFGADPSGRYFLPLAVPLALFAAALILDFRTRAGPHSLESGSRRFPSRFANFGWVVIPLVALPIGYNLWGTLQCLQNFPPGLTTQFYAPTRVDQRAMPELVEFLRGQGETRGYTNYWVSYPLAFLSQEALIYVPRLPYHPDFRYTERDDRYPPYAGQVAQAERVAYIVTNHPALEERLRQGFAGLGVTWQETRIGEFQVFYALSQVVRPEQLGLGVTTP